MTRSSIKPRLKLFYSMFRSTSIKDRELASVKILWISMITMRRKKKMKSKSNYWWRQFLRCSPKVFILMSLTWLPENAPRSSSLAFTIVFISLYLVLRIFCRWDKTSNRLWLIILNLKSVLTLSLELNLQSQQKWSICSKETPIRERSPKSLDRCPHWRLRFKKW